MHHTRSSSFAGIVEVVCAKSAQVTSLVRDDRGRAVTGPGRPAGYDDHWLHPRH